MERKSESIPAIEAKWKEYLSLKGDFEMHQCLGSLSDLWKSFHAEQSPSKNRLRFFIGYVLWSFFHDLERWSFDEDRDDYTIGMGRLREELKARFPSVMSAVNSGDDQASMEATISMIAQICPIFHHDLGGLYYPTD